MSENEFSVPIAPTEESLRLLLRAKLMLSHALEHATQKTEFDNMIAILGLDHTIESVLRCIVRHLDLEAKSGKNFDIASLAAEINRSLIDLTGVRLYYLDEIKLLRQTRNLVQHGAVAPNADLERFTKITRRFFDKVLQVIFGLDLDTLEVSSVIKDVQIKIFLVSAENFIKRKEWLLSVVSSRDAFENEYFKRVKQLSTSILLYPSILYGMKEFDYLGTGFDVIKEELELSYLGINNIDYRRFQEYVNHIPEEYISEDVYGHSVLQRPWDKDDALFCYTFSANTILKWQEKDKEELYIPLLDKNIDFVETINEIDISKDGEINSRYYSNNSDVFILSYVPRDTMRQIEALEINKIYPQRTERFVEGVRDKGFEEQIKLLGKYKFLVTNNPERWGIVLWYKSIEDE